MTEPSSMDKAFIRKLTDIVLANLGNENFGAEELAKEAGISRASLYRKLQSLKKEDISQFIRGVRLNRAMEMLENNEGTASEIAFRVGFGSSAYFTKCFHEYYGFPPGEVKKRFTGTHHLTQTHSLNDHSVRVQKISDGHGAALQKNKGLKRNLFILSGIVVGLLLIWLLYFLVIKIPGNKAKSISEGKIIPIIVLPFDNLSNNPDDQYFADGVMEAILTNLSHINEFWIISKTTAEQFRQTDLTSPEIARKLNIKYVLEGSAFISENKVRVFVNLIDALNDKHLWSETYDREIQDIFSVQSDIAFQIANKLQTTLSSEEIAQISRIPTKNIEAYSSYLYGRFFLNKNPQESNLNKSIEYFEKSIKLDPEFTLAYAGMAKAYLWLAHYGYIPWMEGRKKTRELAEEAIKIDKTIADAHFILGYLARYGFKWEESMKEFRLAIDYEPDNPIGHYGYSMVLFATGKMEEAREQINKAQELDPLSLEVLETSALFYLNEGKIDEMGNELRKMQDIDPGNNHVYRLYPSYYMNKGDTLNAMRAHRKACDTDPVYSKYGNELMNIYNKSGYKAALEFWLNVEIENKNPIFIAATCIGLDRNEEALTWLEKAFEEQHSMIYSIYYSEPYKKLRSEPRFQAIIDKMGLSEYIKESPEDTE